LVAVALPQQTGSPVGAFDGDIAAAEDLGIFGIEKFFQFDRAHFRNCHVAPLVSDPKCSCQNLPR
jgi:hypothetical protein